MERKLLFSSHPFLPYFDKPQLLTFGRLQSTDFCSWESNGEEDKWCSDLLWFHSYFVKIQREPSMNHSYMWSYTRDSSQDGDWTASQRWQGSGTLVKLDQKINIQSASQRALFTWIRCNISAIGNISCKDHHLEVTYTSRRPDLKNWSWYCEETECHIWPCGEMYSAALIKEWGGRSFV